MRTTAAGARLIFALLLTAAPLPAQSTAADQQFVFAYRLLQRGDDALARDAWQDFLADYPQDERAGDAGYFLALIARREGDHARAADLLDALAPPRLVPAYALALLHGQTLADLKRYDAAMALLEAVRDDDVPPDQQPALRSLRATVYRAIGNLPAAAAQLELAAAQPSPLRDRLRLDLAQLQAELNRTDAALTLLEELIASGEPAVRPSAALLAGDIALRTAQPQRALAFYQPALLGPQSDPAFPHAATGTMWAQLEAQQFEALLTTHRQYHALLTGEPAVEADYLAASALMELRRHDEALALLAPLAVKASGVRVGDRLLYKLASAAFEARQWQVMRDALGQLRRTFPASTLLREAALLEAAAETQDGDASKAAAQLTQLIQSEPDPQRRRAALLQRAQVFEQVGRLDAAVNDLTAYLEQENDPDAALRRIDLMQRLDRHDQAVAAADALLSQPNPQPAITAQAMYRKGLSLLRLQQLPAAQQVFETLDREQPAHAYRAPLTYYLGLIALSRGESEEGMRRLREASEQDALDPSLRSQALRLVWLHLRQAGRDDEAATVLAMHESLAGLPELDAEPRRWLAGYRLEHDQPAEALRLVERDPSPAAGLLAGEALRRLRRFEESDQRLREVVRQDARLAPAAELALARLLADRGDAAGALRAFDALSTSPQEDVAAGALDAAAHLYAAGGAGDEARARWKRLVVLYGDERFAPLPQRALLCLYDVESARADTAAAGALLRELIENYPQSAYADFARAVVAQGAGRTHEARALLDRARAASTDPMLSLRVRQWIDAMIAGGATAGEGG